MTPSQTQSFNAGFILICARPVFAALWAWLGKRNRDPNPGGQVRPGPGAGRAPASSSWCGGASLPDASFRVPMVFLGLAYLLHSTGELCLSPVGLSR